MTIKEKNKIKELRYDRGNIEITGRGDGFLRARLSIARPGVFPYLTPSGDIRMEAKLPEDIFSEMTINSAKGAPVTDGHPPFEDNEGLVSTANWQKYVKGALGDSVSIDNDMLNMTETIFDSGLIADLKAGKKLEISMGLETIVDYTPGEWNGERYDARQTNIRVNHVAHVEKGRAGESIRSYLDSADTKVAVMHEVKKTIRRDSKMDILEAIKKFLISLGVKFGEPGGYENGTEPVKGGTKQAQAADEGNNKNSAEVVELKKQLTESQAKIDALEALTSKQKERSARGDENAKLNDAVNKRLMLIDTAKSVIPDFKHDGLTDRDIMLKVIETTLPYDKSVKTDELDEVFIQARFDAALSLAKEKANITGETVSTGRVDEAEIEKKKNKRLKMMEE